MRLLHLLSVAVIVGGLCGPAAKAETPPRKTPEFVKDFELRDFRGKLWSLQRDTAGKHVVVAFLGVECPLVKLYAQRLEKLRSDYQNDVVVIGINSNLQDTLTEMAGLARRHQLQFPYLKDPANQVADLFGAERTPEVFVLDPQGKVRYRGRIDDQYTYGLQRPQVTQQFLRDALDALLAGKEVDTPVTEAVGCHIGRVLAPRIDSDVTYSNQIARIFQKRCVECHREGEIGPFPLTSYEESVGWAEMIWEVTQDRWMPPWHAAPGKIEYQNDARLSDEELSLIKQWVEAGAPEGDPKELPEPREFSEGWRIGEPDMIVWMTERPSETFKVPATGEVPYKYFVVDPGFKEDRWIQAAECRPDAREVVHHIIVAVKGSKDGVHGRKSEWLSATAPGAAPLMLPPGQAKFVPAGSKLIFQMHYTPNGVAMEDRSCIGLKFADPESVRHKVATHAASNTRIRIPPHAENHQEKSSYTFKADGYLRSLFPHMHLRGKAFRYTAFLPDGREKTLLDVPNYDFNWQNSYVLKEPLLMPKGTRIECVAVYDNSEYNLANPDPDQAVRWGDQTWDEMMIGYFDIYDAAPLPKPRPLGDVNELKPEPLIRLAKGSINADGDFQKLYQAIQSQLPQVDRIDWIRMEPRQMHVELVANHRAVAPLGGKRVVGATGMQLVKISAAGKPVEYGDLSKAPGLDLRYMNALLQSSFHVPVKSDEEAGVISFWSTRPNAFKHPRVQQVLTDVARQAAASQ